MKYCALASSYVQKNTLKVQITCKILVMVSDVPEFNATQNKNCSESGFISGRSQLWDLSCQELFTSSIYMIHNCSQPQIKHHKKVKIKHRTYLIFYFEIPYSLYTRTFAETLSTKAAVNFQNILHIFPQQKDKSQCKLYCSAVIFGWG